MGILSEQDAETLLIFGIGALAVGVLHIKAHADIEQGLLSLEFVNAATWAGSAAVVLVVLAGLWVLRNAR